MKTWFILALISLPLSACASLPGGGISTVITSKEAFDSACAQRQQAYDLFRLYDAVRPVSSDVRQAVRVANNQAMKACEKPPANLAEASLIVTRAVMRIRNATKKD